MSPRFLLAVGSCAGLRPARSIFLVSRARSLLSSVRFSSLLSALLFLPSVHFSSLLSALLLSSRAARTFTGCVPKLCYTRAPRRALPAHRVVQSAPSPSVMCHSTIQNPFPGVSLPGFGYRREHHDRLTLLFFMPQTPYPTSPPFGRNS